MPGGTAERRIFHESWYRLAGERLALRASVRVRRQLFRGSRWYVLHEPFTDQYFRLRPPAWELVARLDTGRTVDEVWREIVETDPENAPGQEEVIQLLSQLYHANLLHYDLPADSEQLFDRFKKRRQSVRRATLRSIMFMRIPLFDPDAALRRIAPLLRLVISPVGAAVWLAVIIAAVTVVVNRSPDLRIQAQGILSLGNIPLLYLSMILIKTLHELGHACAVRRFGGSVHTVGVMFLIFNPLPYTDTTAAWAFRSKWRRAFVGAAGMISELFLAALAAFVWAGTGPGTLHSLAYNIMFIASISTIVFNLNPLMRFDGYYILSDLLDIPNLNSRSSQHLRHLVERHAFGYRKSESPAATRSEAAWLTIFGLTSGAYRVVVFSTILLVIADRFLLLGILMAAVCAVAWVLTPLLRFIHYIAASPRLERTRRRAALVSLGAAAVLAGLLAFIPFPSGFKAPGVLQAAQRLLVVNSVSGGVQDILVQSGARVQKGQPLLTLSNPELDYRLQEITARMQEAQALRTKALHGSPADLAAIDGTIASIQDQVDRARRDNADLVIRAAVDGLWVAPEAVTMKGMWIPRGTPIGQLIDDSSFDFVSVIPQRDASEIFSGTIRRSQVRLSGQADHPLPVTEVRGSPVEQTRLPSAALGLPGGGNLATSASDTTGMMASQPFYELRLGVTAAPGAVLYSGLSGRVRFTLQPQPLLRQAWRKLRQLLQARYQV